MPVQLLLLKYDSSSNKHKFLVEPKAEKYNIIALTLFSFLSHQEKVLNLYIVLKDVDILAGRDSPVLDSGVSPPLLDGFRILLSSGTECVSDLD